MALIDRNSATAMALRDIIEKLIADKARAVQRPSHDFDKTQVMRGELVAYRRVYKEITLTPTEIEDDDE